MLREDIMEFVSFSGCKTLNDIIDKAYKREIKLELRMKQNSEPVQIAVGYAKRPKNSDSCIRGQQGRSRRDKYSNPHGGVCQFTDSVCFSCGVSGHMSRDCPRSPLICFRYSQADHTKADCSRLFRGAVVASAPATLRITNDC